MLGKWDIANRPVADSTGCRPVSLKSPHQDRERACHECARRLPEHSSELLLVDVQCVSQMPRQFALAPRISQRLPYNFCRTFLTLALCPRPASASSYRLRQVGASPQTRHVQTEPV